MKLEMVDEEKDIGPSVVEGETEQGQSQHFMNARCPFCKSGLLEFRSGDFGSGVFHPDGGEERLYEEFYECDRCGRKFDSARAAAEELAAIITAVQQRDECLHASNCKCEECECPF